MSFPTLDLVELAAVVGGGETPGTEPTGAGLNQDTSTGPNGTTTNATDNYGLCMRKAQTSCDTSTRWGPFGLFSDSNGAAACTEQQRQIACSKLPRTRR
jgi:hypothetical protein